MKVALVHDWLNGMRGGEKILEVLAEIFPQAHVYTLLYEPEKISPLINKLPVTTSFIQNLPWRRVYYRYYLPLFPRAIESFKLAGYDLVISTSHCVAKGVKVPAGTRHLCYCFTPMRYVWEFSRDYFGLKALMLRPFLAQLRRWDVRTAVRPDFFWAISQNVAGRIKKYYNRDSLVVYPPVDTDFFVPQEKDENFYLIVSALVPYKRIDVAVEAFTKLGRPLKIVGAGTEWKRLRKIAGPNIDFLGWQPDEMVRNLYAACRALVFPGIEDFGITILEAQSCGRPVIAFRAGGALETINVKARTGIFFDLQTPARLLSAIEEFETAAGAFDKQKIRESVLGFDRQVFKKTMESEIKKYLKYNYAEI